MFLITNSNSSNLSLNQSLSNALWHHFHFLHYLKYFLSVLVKYNSFAMTGFPTLLSFNFKWVIFWTGESSNRFVIFQPSETNRVRISLTQLGIYFPFRILSRLHNISCRVFLDWAQCDLFTFLTWVLCQSSADLSPCKTEKVLGLVSCVRRRPR